MGKSGSDRGIAAYKKMVNSKDKSAKDDNAAPEPDDVFIKQVKPAPKPIPKPVPKPKDKNDNEARRFLLETLGEEKGDALYKSVPKSSGYIFDFLEDFNTRQLSLFFRNESPAVEALVLSRLPSKIAAEVLADASPERKAEVSMRIAKMGETSPEVLERTAAALREKARRFSLSPDAEEATEIDGMETLTAILKAGEISFGDRILDELDKDDPGISRFIKERLSTLEDAATMPDRVMEEKLRTMTDKEIIYLLKNPLESFKKKITDNLPDGREQRIMEEAGFLGPVAKIEVEAAARDFMVWYRENGPWVGEDVVK